MDFNDYNLESVLSRPEMYFGQDPLASFELAAFINGYMAHRSGFIGGFGMACMVDKTKTIQENAEVFKKQILDWSKGKENWRCCVDGVD